VAVQVAWPLPFSALPPQPEMVAPLAVNVTVPVGVPLEEDTLAVKVTVLAAFDGFALLPMDVEVGVAAEYVIVTDQSVIDIGLVSPPPLMTVSVHCPFAVVDAYLLVSVGAVQFVALL
jgi:hypothetical protein